MEKEFGTLRFDVDAFYVILEVSYDIVRNRLSKNSLAIII